MQMITMKTEMKILLIIQFPSSVLYWAYDTKDKESVMKIWLWHL